MLVESFRLEVITLFARESKFTLAIENKVFIIGYLLNHLLVLDGSISSLFV